MSVPSARIMLSEKDWTAWFFKMGPIGSPETSVLNQITQRNNPEDGIIQLNRAKNYDHA